MDPPSPQSNQPPEQLPPPLHADRPVEALPAGLELVPAESLEVPAAPQDAAGGPVVVPDPPPPEGSPEERAPGRADEDQLDLAENLQRSSAAQRRMNRRMIGLYLLALALFIGGIGLGRHYWRLHHRQVHQMPASHLKT